MFENITLEPYAELEDELEIKLDEANQAVTAPARLTGDEVFSAVVGFTKIR